MQSPYHSPYYSVLYGGNMWCGRARRRLRVDIVAPRRLFQWVCGLSRSLGTWFCGCTHFIIIIIIRDRSTNIYKNKITNSIKFFWYIRYFGGFEGPSTTPENTDRLCVDRRINSWSPQVRTVWNQGCHGNPHFLHTAAAGRTTSWANAELPNHSGCTYRGVRVRTKYFSRRGRNRGKCSLCTTAYFINKCLPLAS